MRPAFLGCGVSNVDRSSLTPQCLVSLCRRMDFCTKPTAHGTSGRGGAVLVFAPPSTAAGSGRFGNHPRLPARHGQRRQPVCRGFQGAFLFGAVCGILLLVLSGGWLLPPCAGELNWSAGSSRAGPPQPSHSRGSQPPTAQKDGEARRRNFPRPPGSGGGSRRPRRWRRKPPTKLRGRRYVAHGTSHQDPAKRPAGETDGNHGESTGTGGNPQRTPTHKRESGQAPDRQHPRQRQLFRFSQLSNNGAASGTCNRPGITQFHGTFHWIYGGSGLDSTDPGPQADLSVPILFGAQLKCGRPTGQDAVARCRRRLPKPPGRLDGSFRGKYNGFHGTYSRGPPAFATNRGTETGVSPWLLAPARFQPSFRRIRPGAADQTYLRGRMGCDVSTPGSPGDYLCGTRGAA